MLMITSKYSAWYNVTNKVLLALLPKCRKLMDKPGANHGDSLLNLVHTNDTFTQGTKAQIRNSSFTTP